MAGARVWGIRQRRKKTQSEWKKCRTWFPAQRSRQWGSSNLDISAKKIIKLECRSRKQPYFEPRLLPARLASQTAQKLKALLSEL